MSSPEAPAPDAALPREHGYDLARALAIIAMVFVNFFLYLQMRPPGLEEEVVWRWLLDAPSGRSSSLFVTLAGVGVAAMRRRGLRSDVRRALVLRGLFLFCAGNILVLAWQIDILHFYAFYLALAGLLFVYLRGRALLAAAGAVLALSFVLGWLLADVSRDDFEYWTPSGMALDVLVKGIHPLVPWIAFVLVGMWIGERPLDTPDLRRRLALRGLAAFVLAELVSRALSLLAVEGMLGTEAREHLGLFTTGWSPAPLFVVSAAGSAAAIMALAASAAERWPRASRPLIHTGQLSLSIYVLHALVGVGVLTWGFHLEGKVSVPWVLAWWVGFTAVVVVGAHFYRRRFARGPLEWLLRVLTGSLRPRAAPEAAAAAVPRVPGWSFLVLGALALALLAGRVVGLREPSLACRERAIASRADLAGELSLACPHARFALDLAGPEELTLTVRSGVDLYLEVYGAETGAAVTRLADDDDSGPGLDPELTVSLPAGRSTVVVRPYADALGPFFLRARGVRAP